MSSARRSVQDFIAQIAAQTPGTKTGATYSASLNSDGSVAVSQNGTVIYPKVQWAMGVGEAVTDSNISGDGVTLINNDGTVGRGSAQHFINSLI
jgi:hypothetical protein